MKMLTGYVETSGMGGDDMYCYVMTDTRIYIKENKSDSIRYRQLEGRLCDFDHHFKFSRKPTFPLIREILFSVGEHYNYKYCKNFNVE